MPAISWLHLTDLHYGMKGQEWLWPNLRQEFYDDLTRIAESAGPWDAVIFSGDLTQKGTKEEFSRLDDVLRDLWLHLKSLGSEPTFICVPGNHDLERPASHDPLVKAFKLWSKDKEIRDVFWDNPTSEYKLAIDKYFTNYITWLNDLQIPKPTTLIKGYLPGDFSTILTKGDYKIGIVGINSGFLQMTDDNYECKLDLHEKQLCLSCSNDPIAWKKEVDLAFLVSHHPSNWLSANSKKIFNSEISPPGMFFAHICGHLHKPNCLSYSEFGSEERRIWQGPSIFGLKTYGKDNAERFHGYSSCRIDFFDDESSVTIWPRKMAEKYSGNRKLGPDSGYDLNENNAIIIEFATKKREQKDEINRMDISDTCNNVEDIAITEPNYGTSINLVYDANDINRLPQLKLKKEMQHLAIRNDDRHAFCTELISQRRVWLISDWGQGKQGFISAALMEGFALNLPTVFRLQCEEINDVEELINVFDDQFGITLQKFVNITSEIVLPILLLDNIPPEILQSDNQKSRFKEITKALIEYNDKMCLILGSRKEIVNTDIEIIKLCALDLVETNAYISTHSDATASLMSTDKIEHLYMWSDGLPMYLDYLIRSLRVTQFKDLVSIEMETKYDELQQSEPVPKALLYAVASLAQSDNRYSRRSFRLLKILSVLSDGEPLEIIKRFDNAEPFYYQNALELEGLGLLEIIQLIGLEPEISQKKCSLETDYPILLKVPKQVRDYIKTIISEKEYSIIINRAADMLFGEKWKEGTVRIASTALKQMIGTRSSGLGNEHTVIRKLLWEAVQKSDLTSVKKVILLATSYLKKLNAVGRYKDVCYSAEELIHIVSSDEYLQLKVDLLLIYGGSSRMTGDREVAIEVLSSVIDDANITLTRQQKSGTFIDLALAYDTKDDNDKALDAASTVTSLEKKGSSYYDQAQSIIIKRNKDKYDVVKELTHIEKKSRRLKRSAIANNTAITLASLVSSVENKIRYYDTVIDSNGDDYNRVRAAINKTDELLKHNRISELRHKDKHMLQMAFSYTYSQKMENLFNKCTRVIWDLLATTGRYDQLLKLFRYSSFLWRIRGEQDLEKKYIEKVTASSAKLIECAQEVDVKYFNMRLKS
jgi:predicted MPP superfamily phosphohydrolase